METSPVDHESAAAIEATEARAWADLRRRARGLGSDVVGRWEDVRLVYFDATVAPFGSMAERALEVPVATARSCYWNLQAHELAVENQPLATQPFADRGELGKLARAVAARTRADADPAPVVARLRADPVALHRTRPAGLTRLASIGARNRGSSSGGALG